MKLPKSSGKPKRPSIFLRRIVGDSMLPAFRASQIVIGFGWFTNVSPGDVVIIRHGGLEKIKRVHDIQPDKGVFVLGDNPSQSTDSRSFGWLDFDEIIAKVIWPHT